MALKLDTLVCEASTTTGTGAYALAGPITEAGFTYNDFSFLADSDTTWVTVTGGADFEEVLVTKSGATLLRTAVLRSSNGDAAVDWPAGPKRIWCTVPAQTMEGLLGRSALPDVILQDQKASGTDGGSSSTTLNIRVLNTKVRDARGECTLSSNQFVLAAGTWYAEFSAPAALSEGHQVYLYNATGSALLVPGVVAYVSTLGGQTIATGAGVFTVAAGQSIELRHYINAGAATFGLGVGVASGITNVFGEVRLWRMS